MSRKPVVPPDGVAVVRAAGHRVFAAAIPRSLKSGKPAALPG